MSQATIVKPNNIAFGVGHDIDPTRIIGIPLHARVKVKQRADDFVMVFVRTLYVIEKWALRQTDEGWELMYLQARNSTGVTR